MLTVLVATIKNLFVCSPGYVANFEGCSNLWFDSVNVLACARKMDGCNSSRYCMS
jgi:hypothetical protein